MNEAQMSSLEHWVNAAHCVQAPPVGSLLSKAPLHLFNSRLSLITIIVV